MRSFTTIVSLSLLTFLSFSTVSAQIEKEEIKVIVIEKTVDQNGNVNENKNIITGEEAKKYIKEMEISDDSNMWTNDEEVKIDHDAKENSFIQKKKVKMIQIGEDGSEEVIEWSGEGEMPEEIKKKMEQHDIDIIMEKEDREVKVTVDSDGSSHSKINIYKNHNGEEQEIEIDVEGDDLSDEMKKLLEEKGIDINILESEDGSEKRIVVVTDEEDVETSENKAQLGVYLNTENKGVRVAGIIEGSSAESAGILKGDIIMGIGNNKVTTIQEVVNEIGQYTVGDIIIVHYIRDNKNESREVTLKARKLVGELMNQESYENVIEIENEDGTKKKVKKYIIIEKEK